MARDKTTRAKAARAKSARTARAGAAKAKTGTKAARAKTAVRKSSTRKAAARPSAPKRAAKTAGRADTRKAVRKPARSASRPARRPPQRFVVSHHRDEDFATGLRAYAQYRDLGIAQATGGLAQAHVIRLIGPCDPTEVSKLHYHDVEFQMVYVLKGWVRASFAGQGDITMREGSCWIQPPRIQHMILDYSDTCELLEIILPAEFDTIELAT
ncbi:cupin domain-containing protein [Bradyrhizobium sp. 2TAF24]|uniref:cupin domain-containing protein n=1 Tax=Bradyrhizobium sp. 2TAF24 TaxID=3233011 RepID=UPI003F92E178